MKVCEQCGEKFRTEELLLEHLMNEKIDDELCENEN